MPPFLCSCSCQPADSPHLPASTRTAACAVPDASLNRSRCDKGVRSKAEQIEKAAVGGATVAVLGIGALTGQGAFARTASTPPTTSSAAAGTATATAEQAADQAEYQAFLAALGTNLGVSDPTKVDAAIRAALKQMVDDRLKAGNISANAATSEKAAIDASTGADPLRLGEHGRHGSHGGKTGSDNDQNAKGGASDANDSGNGSTGASGNAANSANASS